MNNIIVLSYLRSIIKNEAKNKFYIIITLSVLTSVFVALTPVIISKLTALLQVSSGEHTIIFFMGLSYVLIISLEKIVSFLSVYIQNILRIQCVACISEDYLFRLYKKENSDGMSNSGDMSQRLNQASNDIYVMISNVALTLFPPILQLSLAIIFILNSGDFVVSLMFLLYAFTFVFINYFFIKKLVLAREQLMDSGRNTYKLLVDSVKNIPVVRSFNSFSFFFKRFRKTLSDDTNTQNTYWRLDFFNVLCASSVQIVFFFSAFSYTLYNVIYGSSTLSHFILISSYLLIITSPLEHLASSFISFLQAHSSFKKFITFMNDNVSFSRKVEEFSDKDICETISLKNVNVAYNDHDGIVLGPVSLSFRRGAFTTVTGKSGSGKTTLVKLLMRQLQLSDGSYKINGHNAFTLGDDLFFSTVAYVSQDDFVFMDTVAFNLEIASPGASREEMLAALDMSDFRLPDISGEEILGKILTNEGSNLSGGQRQRLSLARLFLRSPQIIILDEITSSLDIPSEINLLTRVRTKFPEATIINISHRPSAFSLSDEILVIEKGLVSDYGPYHTIRRKNKYLSHILDKGLENN